ncbi:hypothetical protein P167DRAFT_575298 [Morchella conica CCBAS932]|uniref:Uncharacterized protein n=1 Tax=Morchella conica CCBAS932 TaxID=1392247 RepID=A0A3N4L0P7_9PEZI|nr:hypothetical protein P167DRAFT_575298 [Morchella conica CCBAS932]
MPVYSKRYRHLKSARYSKRKPTNAEVADDAEDTERNAELCWMNPIQDQVDRVDSESLEDIWLRMADRESLSDAGSEENEESEEECEYTDGEQDIINDNVFDLLLESSKGSGASSVKLRYQRGPTTSERTLYSNNKRLKQLSDSAKGCKPLTNGFLSTVSGSLPIRPISEKEKWLKENRLAIHNLQKKLRSIKQTEGIIPQNLTRHRAILAYMNMQVQRWDNPNETRRSLALCVARRLGRGCYFARKLVSWELSWKRDQVIEIGRQGCLAKTRSWFDDEGVQLAAREWISSVSDAELSAHGLAKAIGVYLDPRRAEIHIADALNDIPNIEKFGPGGNRIRVRTARKWLKRLGLVHGTVRKGVYVDGHERDDVIEYRDKVFIPQWREYQRRLVIFNENGDGGWRSPETLLENERPLVWVTHDESTFNANDGKRKMWMKVGQQPIRPKSRGKGIIISGFLTPGGHLRVPDHITDTELITQNLDWPLKPDGKPVRESFYYLEYGKDNYWTGDKMVDHAVKIAIPIFNYAFPE